MANDVFANGREVSCKKADGKSICAFPDVCFTPPENPATPPGVPVPYPNTGMAKDMTAGSKSVKITGQEVMLKNKSYFKKSYGDEAGCAAKKGIVTSVNRGKVYFISWSMDVKFEGENVVRHLDMTTHNHASPTTNTAPWTYADRMAIAIDFKECDGAREEVEKKCKNEDDEFNEGEKPQCPSNKEIKDAEEKRNNLKKGSVERFKAQKDVKKNYEDFAKGLGVDSKLCECHEALRCFLSPFRPTRCCPGQTPHHVIDASSFLEQGIQNKFKHLKYPKREHRNRKKGWEKYSVNKAPCVCSTGPNQSTASHGVLHARTSVKAENIDPWTVGEAIDAGLESINETFPSTNTKQCNECMKKQLRKFHDDAKTTDDDPPIDKTTEGPEWMKDLFRKPTTVPVR